MAFTPVQLDSGRWRSGYRAAGTRVLRTFDTFSEAEEWATTAEAAAKADATHPAIAPPAPKLSSVTITEHGATWLALKAHLARATVDGYATHLRAIAATGLGACAMSSLVRSDVQRWVIEQDAAGVGRPSINARLKVLRMVYKDAAAEGLVTHDPTLGVADLKCTIRQDNTLDANQVQALLDNATPELRAMVLLGVDAGLRWSEVAGLPVSAIVGDYIVVRQVVERSSGSVRGFTKSGQVRKVPIATERLAAALRPLMLAAADDVDALLFTNSAGRCIDYWDWRRDQWRPLLRAAKVRCRFHDLRHTLGSNLAADGAPRSEIAKVLGHADEATTARYIHAGDDGRRLALMRHALATG
jgi:integrase